MGRGSARERVLGWALIGACLLVAVVAMRDTYRTVGRTVPGFALMENAQVGVGGAPRGGLSPLDVVLTANGQRVTRAAEIFAEVARHPPGTPIAYTIERFSRVIPATVPSITFTIHDFLWFLLDGSLPGLLVVGLGALVLYLRPGTPESRLFLAFCIVTALINLTYTDLMLSHRFTRLLLALWSFTPALILHLALTFPERRAIVARRPWLVCAPYAVSAVLAVWLQVNFTVRNAPVGEIIAGYAGLAALVLIGSLAWTLRESRTRLARRRARVLLWGIGIGYVVPVLGTSTEMVFGVSVPYLSVLWKLNTVFPASVAYAIVRYRLFDVRSAIRMGAVYSLVTGLVAVGYVGLLTALNFSLSQLEMDASPVVVSAAVALVVVLLMNPIYGRVRTLVDRLFFRAQYDARRALESLADQMTTVLELDRLHALITGTVREIFHPVDVALLLPADGVAGFRGVSAAGRAVSVPDDGPLSRALAEVRGPLTGPGSVTTPTSAASARRASPSSSPRARRRWRRSSSAARSPRSSRSAAAAGTPTTPATTSACSASSPTRARWPSRTPARTTRWRRPCAAYRSSSRSAPTSRSSSRAPCRTSSSALPRRPPSPSATSMSRCSSSTSSATAG